MLEHCFISRRASASALRLTHREVMLYLQGSMEPTYTSRDGPNTPSRRCRRCHSNTLGASPVRGTSSNPAPCGHSRIAMAGISKRRAGATRQDAVCISNRRPAEHAGDFAGWLWPVAGLDGSLFARLPSCNGPDVVFVQGKAAHSFTSIAPILQIS